MKIDLIFKVVPCNYWLLCKQFESGHRAGYVGVPKGHPLYGRDEDWPVVRMLSTLLGPVTYADHRVGGWEGHPRDENLWWFGVDNMQEDEPRDDLADVLNAIKGLAKELSSYEGRKGKGHEAK